MAAILELRAVKAFYGQSEVLHGIDLAVEEGGMTVLLGANGAGKTTTLRAICGMVHSAACTSSGSASTTVRRSATAVR